MTKYSNLALFDYNLPSLITESCLSLHTSLYTHCTLHYTHHLIKIVKQLGVCFSIIDNILAKRYVDRKLCPPSISSRCYDAKVSRATTAFPNQFLYPHLNTYQERYLQLFHWSSHRSHAFLYHFQNTTNKTL